MPRFALTRQAVLTDLLPPFKAAAVFTGALVLCLAINWFGFGEFY